MELLQAQTFTGRRVLLVEDNFLVGAAIRRMLQKLGCEVVGPVAALDEARRLARDETIDAGVLDINIIGGTSAGVAETLIERKCPFFFVTGYASPQFLPRPLLEVRRLNKPLDEYMLGAALAAALT